MFPPIDSSVLGNNPGFERLYNSLTSTILNADGSTKNDPAVMQRDAHRDELKEYRMKETRKHLLKNTLATMPSPSSQPPTKQHQRTKSQLSNMSSQKAVPLPPELVELLLLLPSFLEQGQTMRTTGLELLLSSPPFSDFPSLLPQLSSAVSSHLMSQARGLARVQHPTTNPSFIHRAIPHILPTTQSLLSTLSSNRATLTSYRLNTASSLVKHLNQHTEALLRLLRSLEAKHGPAAQFSTLQVSEASLEAKLWAASLNLFLRETRAHVYPPESQYALKNYRNHLRDAQMQLSNKLRTREQELGEYGVFISLEEGGLGIGRADEAREHKFREMARIWREMENRLREINGDLKRLDSQ
ncbi:hypothetical protein SCUP234_12614 [Seiridium cupressi]